MSVLGAPKLRKITLPSGDDWIEVNIALPAKDMMGIDAGTDEEKSFAIIAAAIKDWSFTKADGTKADITAENVSLLSTADMIVINQALGFTSEMMAATQKKS